MMTTRTRIAGLLLAAAVLTTACGGGNTQAQVPIGSADPFPAGGSSSAPATTSAAAPTTTAAAADAAGQASAALTHYFDVINQLSLGSGDVSLLNTVATGIEVTNATNEITATRASGKAFQSGADLKNTAVGSIDSSKMPATVQITACVEGGVPAGQASSVPRPSQQGRFYMTNTSWPDPAGWRVSDSDLRGDPCIA
jgi:hypothetical protein